MGKKPNFIGIGTTKAATTWIFQCLKEHPEICGSSVKDTRFFNTEYYYRKGLNYYYSFFKNCPKNSIKGEITPDYIYHQKTPYLIRKHFPDVKIIIVLRNPIEKIYSEYRFQKIRKLRLSIYKTLEEAIKKDPMLTKMGYYYKQISKYYDLFPNENILILFFDDIEKNPIEFMKKIYTFIGAKNIDFIPPSINRKINIYGEIVGQNKIPYINSISYKMIIHLKEDRFVKKFIKKIRLDEFLQKFLVFNVKRLIKTDIVKNNNNLSMNTNTKNYLRLIYKEEIKKLEKFLGIDLSHWKEN